MSVLQEQPKIGNPTAFNLARWADLIADPIWKKVEGRIETDRFGNVILTPPADPEHGGKQFDIGLLISRSLPQGRIQVECPIATSEGVKVADVIWGSKARMAKIKHRSALLAAPEICIEVLSPSNTRDEMTEKKRLYFEAGAEEVWLCSTAGEINFYLAGKPSIAKKRSALCPEMPTRLPSDA